MQKVIHIEDISTPDDIETAMHIRFTEGKHVIPVPSIEITRSAPEIVFDTVRVRFGRSSRLKNNVSEKDNRKAGVLTPQRRADK